MLSRLSEVLRSRFGEPGHREAKVDLPDSLRESLRKIPREWVLCRDIDRLWAPLLHRELPREEEARYRGHLEACDRCAELFASFEAERLETFDPPEALLQALRRAPATASASGRRGSFKLPPWWVLDVKYAAAVSYSLAILAVTFCGKPADCLERAGDWQVPVAAFAERMEDESKNAVRSLAEVLRKAPYLRRHETEPGAESFP